MTNTPTLTASDLAKLEDAQAANKSAQIAQSVLYAERILSQAALEVTEPNGSFYASTQALRIMLHCQPVYDDDGRMLSDGRGDGTRIVITREQAYAAGALMAVKMFDDHQEEERKQEIRIQEHLARLAAIDARNAQAQQERLAKISEMEKQIQAGSSARWWQF